MKIEFQSIGVIHTPYKKHAPFQPETEAAGEFKIIVNPQYTDGLQELEQFTYIFVLSFMNRALKPVSMMVEPSWAEGTRVGLFASRSPVRPNPIGLSVVRLKAVRENVLYTSGLDVFDGTPLLDIKPYLQDLDAKPDANYGWVEKLKDREHLLLHIKGIPH